MQNNSPEEIFQFFTQIRNPVQFIDSRIDADALCSAIALYHVLDKRFAIKLTLCYEKAIPQRYFDQLANFADVPEISQNTAPKNYDFSKHDCMIYTDTGNLQHVSSTSDFELPAHLKVVNIDHHAGNNGFGHYNYAKTLGSACTVLYELIKEWNIQPEKQVANLLLMGIMLDTGFYSYNSTTSKDFLFSAELMEYGADHYKITWNLTFNENEADNKLKKIVFANLVVDLTQKLAYTTVTLEEINKLEFKIEDSFLAPSDLIKKTQGIDFAFTVKDIDEHPNEFNISFRSHHENFNSLALAKMLNPIGGGHLMAAGTIIKADSIKEAIQLVISAANKFRSQGNS